MDARCRPSFSRHFAKLVRTCLGVDDYTGPIQIRWTALQSAGVTRSEFAGPRIIRARSQAFCALSDVSLPSGA